MSLFNLSILLTRPHADNASLRRELERRGVRVLENPLIAVQPVWTDEAVAAWSRLQAYDAVVATSANALRSVREHFPQSRFDSAPPIYVLGKRSADEAASLGWRVRQSDDVRRADDLVGVLQRDFGPRSMGAQRDNEPRVLWLHGQLADARWTEELTASGIRVDDILCYRTESLALSEETWERFMADETRPDRAIVLYSPSAVHALVASHVLRGGVHALLRSGVHCFAIGPTTAKACEDKGLPVAGVASHPKDAAVVEMFEQSTMER